MPITDLERLDLYQAAEIRDSNGRRVYGSTDTLRRDHKRGLLPLEMSEGKYVARRSDLDALPGRRAAMRAARRKASAKAKATKADELEAAALRIAAEAPVLTPQRRDRLRELLGGVL